MTHPVTIIGGGLVGCFAALCLAQQGLHVVLIEKSPFPYLDTGDDGRTTSISYGSSILFENLGLWDDLSLQAAPVRSIRVLEHLSPYTLDFDSDDTHPHPMAYIVGNSHIKTVLTQAVQAHPSIQVYAPVSLKTWAHENDQIKIMLSDGTSWATTLLVSAEGRHAQSRTQTPILQRTWDYDHHALVMHIAHAEPHEDQAWELFDNQRLLAVLPLLPCSITQTYRSGIVFAEKKGFPWNHLSDDNLISMIQDLFPFYGDLSIASQRWVYPISGMRVDRLIDHRYVLIGDAAHGLHPIAGQAVNLGWRDASCLAHHLGQYHKLGLDIGSPTILNAYEKIRKKDQNLLFGATHGLYHLFRSKALGRLGLRSLGMNAINRLPSIKRMLIKKAMGL